MTAKRALVVDDSRSARAFLGRILERHNLVVDAAESAEAAIEYLERHRPDVIFMDHLMPGMDGFQAVRAIKNDPRTATIPILMYTSQEGELYLGQARALGALGVLPKQTRPADVTKALVQLHLIDNEALASAPAMAPAAATTNGSAPAAAEAPPALLSEPLRADTTDIRLHALAPDLQQVVKSLLRDHSSEMRRFVVEHLESHADRIVGDVRSLLKQENPPPLVASPAREPLPPAPSRWPLVASLLAVALAMLLSWQWFRAVETQDALRLQLETTRGELAATRAQLGEIRQRLDAVVAPSAPAAGAATAAPDAWAEPVPFGEPLLAAARVERVQAQLEQLLSQGFRGRVSIQGFAGRFCTTGAGESATLADPDLPLGKCDPSALAGNGGGSARESVAFASMIASARARATGRFTISVETGNPAQLAAAYPAASEKLTAGEWNQAAAQNNRVEMHWYAEP